MKKHLKLIFDLTSTISIKVQSHKNKMIHFHNIAGRSNKNRFWKEKSLWQNNNKINDEMYKKFKKNNNK